MHAGLMSNFKISRLLTEAMHWSSVVIFSKDERIEKGQELGREGKYVESGLGISASGKCYSFH